MPPSPITPPSLPSMPQASIKLPLAAADALSDTSADAPATPPPNPPTEHRLNTNSPPFATTLEAKEELYAFAREHGFAMRIKSNKRKDSNGVPGRIDLLCDRAGKTEHRNKTRQTASARCDCPWSAVIVIEKKTGDYRFTVFGQHNHTRSDAASLHQTHRALNEEHKTFLDSLLQGPKVMPSEAHEAFKKRYPDQPINIDQVYNHRKAANKAELGGLTPTQALVKELREGEQEGVRHKVYYELADSNKPVAVVWAYDWCFEQSKRFGDVLMMDNTYKTNTLGMPLFQVVGMTNLNTLFYACEGLVNSEKLEGFTMLLQGLGELRESEGVPPPAVVITDMDKNMRAAVKALWPDVQLQICIFHINKNIIINVSRKWRAPREGNDEAGDEDEEFDDAPIITTNKSDEQEFADGEQAIPRNQRLAVEDSGELQKLNAYVRQTLNINGGVPDNVPYSKAGVYLLWQHMIYGPDRDHFWQAWLKMKAVFDFQKGIINYMAKQWMPVKEQWAQAWISKYPNRGHRTTSPAEVGNRVIKTELRSGKSTIKQVANAVKKMVDNNKETFILKQGDEKMRLLHHFNGVPWLGNCPHKISRYACQKLVEQHQIMLGALPSTLHKAGWKLKPCTGSFKRQMGMDACAHIMLARHLEKKEALVNASDIDKIWWLERDLKEEMPLLNIKSPDEVVVQKGRPKGPGPFAFSNERVSTRPPISLPSSSAPNSRLASSIRRHKSHWEDVTPAKEAEIRGKEPGKGPRQIKGSQAACLRTAEVMKTFEEQRLAEFTTVSRSGRVRQPTKRALDADV